MGALIVVGLTALILPTHTPGARYYKVTQATISSTICVPCACSDCLFEPREHVVATALCLGRRKPEVAIKADLLHLT
jgi:hypothetical protein